MKYILFTISLFYLTSCYETEIGNSATLTPKNVSLAYIIPVQGNGTDFYFGENGASTAALDPSTDFSFPAETCLDRIEVSMSESIEYVRLYVDGSSEVDFSVFDSYGVLKDRNHYISEGSHISLYLDYAAGTALAGSNSGEVRLFFKLFCD